MDSIYLKNLAKELVKPHMYKRAALHSLSFLLSLQIKNYLHLPSRTEAPDPEENQPGSSKPKCSYCPRRKNRTTTTKCVKCSKPICKEHTVTYCVQCGVSDSE